MPEFHIPITAEELAKRKAIRTSRVDLTPYVSYLDQIPSGGAGYLTLAESENKPTIKRRVTLAANKAGKDIKYVRSAENELIFEVVAPK